MINWWAISIVSGLVIASICFIWLAVSIRSLKKPSAASKKQDKNYADMAEEDVHHMFNKEFREELRNRGRLQFESIINENAAFLKQDLDMTAAQINEDMKKQVSEKLDGEFAAYAKNMQELQEQAQRSLQTISEEIGQRRAAFSEALEKEVAERKDTIIKAYETNMAQVVENYVLQALGEQFDLKAQLPYIISQMEANKKDIIEDMKL